MLNAKEIIFLGKLLEFREENSNRTISFTYNNWGLQAYLHSAVGSFCEDCWVRREGSVEQAIQKVKEYEQSWEEKLEEQKSAISCDAEPSGTTVGTSV